MSDCHTTKQWIFQIIGDKSSKIDLYLVFKITFNRLQS